MLESETERYVQVLGKVRAGLVGPQVGRPSIRRSVASSVSLSVERRDVAPLSPLPPSIGAGFAQIGRAFRPPIARLRLNQTRLSLNEGRLRVLLCCFYERTPQPSFPRHFVNGGKKTVGTSKAATGIMQVDSGVEEVDGCKSEVIFIAQIVVL